MYATIRQYDVTGDPHALSRSIQETLVPQLKGLPGYVSYLWIDPSVEGGRILSVSVFDTLEHADGITPIWWTGVRSPRVRVYGC